MGRPATTIPSVGLAEAKGALDRIAAIDHPADLDLGECYDGLAEAAADCDDFELAVQAQRLDRARVSDAGTRPGDARLVSAEGW